MDWRSFFNEDHSIYVSARHRALHADLVAKGVAALLPAGHPRVLDWGCGEAEGAGTVAAHCARLYLFDTAPRVRDSLRRRYADHETIAVLDEMALAALAPASLEAIVIVSVAQYLSREVLAESLASLKDKLVPGGTLILADVIPPGLSPLVDATALLTFARHGGFLRDAIAGLAKTFFSNYRTLRNSLGLTQWSEADLRALLTAHGFDAQRAPRNIGHNQARMTFVATRR